MRALPWIALTAIVVASWAIRFAGRGTIPIADWLLYIYPVYHATYSRMAQGVVPLWNPYQLCGVPWIATLEAGTFYPSHLLYLVLPMNVASAASQALHLLILALATAAFLRRLGAGIAAMFVAAFVCTLRGMMPFALAAPNILEAITWLPVGAVAIVDLSRAPGGRPIAWLGLATGLSFLAGFPQVTVYAAYAWGTLLVACLIDGRAGARGWLRSAAALGAALVLGGALAAVQMLPAAELASVGTRVTRELAEEVMFGFGPLLSPALPILGLESIEGTFHAFGMVALALIPAALFAPAHRAVAVWAVGLALLTAVFSIGRWTPLFDLYTALPALRWFRNPDRVLIVTNFAAAIAAGLGVEAIAGPMATASSSGGRRGWAVAAALLALGLVCWRASAGNAPPAAWPSVVAFTAVVVTLLAAALALGARGSAVIAAAFAAAVGVEMSRLPWSDLRLPYSADAVAAYGKPAADYEALSALVGHDRFWRHPLSMFAMAGVKLATWYGVRSIADYEPVNLKRSSDVFTYLTDETTVRRRPPYLFTGDLTSIDPPPGVSSAATRRRLLDLAAMRVLLVPLPALSKPEIGTFIEQGGFERQEHDIGNLAVFTNPNALPRAFVTYRARSASADAEATLAALSRADFDPLRESYVEGPVPFEIADDAPRGGPIVFVEDGESVVDLSVTAIRPGLVVLADTFYPGWRATVDGTEAPIVATNHLFRGVPVPAGSHRVRFQYRPWSVYLGGILSTIGLVVLLVLARRWPA